MSALEFIHMDLTVSYQYSILRLPLCRDMYIYRLARTLCIVYCFIAAPVVTGLYQTAPPKRFAILCTSTNSPATIVVWTKEGRRLTKDGGTYRLTQIVTDRRASTYDNIFTPTGTLDSVVGSYTCNVSNRFGYSSKSISIRG